MEKDIVLIIDDSREFTEDLKLMLHDKFEIITAETANAGLDLLQKNQVAVLLLDLQLPDIHGLDLLEKIHNEIDPYLPVIIVTEFDEIKYVVKAMRLGAYDFLSKDFHVDLMKEKINLALLQKRLRLNISGLQNQNMLTDDSFVFASEEMKKVNFEISRLANLNFDVLLSGETGVGKDMIATQIFLRSKRKDKAFISVPIRTLTETLLESELFGHEKGAFTGADRMKIGKFESANQGIVYIPEISNLSESIQLKLLHFMQYKTITRVGHDPRKGEINLDVQVIMATNDNLEELINKGKLREDFFYRITGVTLKIPPLRDRRDDIIPLANYFLKKYTAQFVNHDYSFHKDVLDAFLEYEWKGNVRELSNSIKYALTYSENRTLTLEYFPNILRRKSGHDKTIHLKDSEYMSSYRDFDNKIKKQYFENLLETYDGKISEACKVAQLTPQGFRKILKQLGIEH
jgi:two-component system, NtrC family, response regulator AtoC